ncbi:MAG: EscU/YscU/HrcU family type III secretion system export apparatus switch protein [Candidatus Margulisiibacteriota bacterium]
MAKIKPKKIRRFLSDLELPERSQLKAIAIKYDVHKDHAPKITATGRGAIAEEILKVAEENGIPFYEDPSLAALLAKLELDVNIPAELYTLVAEVLAFVYQLDKLAKKRNAIRKKFVR